MVEVIDTLLNVRPDPPPLIPPVITALEPEQIIVEVPALNVRLVFVPVLTAVAVVVNVTVELPRLIVRVLLLLDESCVAVTLKLLVVKVPVVKVIAPEQVNVPPRLNVAADALIVTEITDTL